MMGFAISPRVKKPSFSFFNNFNIVYPSASSENSYNVYGDTYDLNRNLSLLPLAMERIGVPQGAPISPLVAILAQEIKFYKNLEANDCAYVQYSDDGLVAFDNDELNPTRIVGDPSNGIELSEEKSY
jgi:hypothetical protein